MKQPNNKLVISKSFNPYFNLALEEYLFNNLDVDYIFYLWQNQNTIVVGANQNTWVECDIQKTKNDKIKIARRLSGGGSVFHDTGNLNFTFITKEKNYNLEKQLSVIIKALKTFKINAKFTGRNDILVNNKKFSGNAFYFDNDKSYHHGTLLVDADIFKLSNYLTPSKLKIMSKGITSVKSRVVNLKSLNENLTIENLKEQLINSFKKIYGDFSNTLIVDENYKFDNFDTLYNKYSSWNWVFGESPTFDIQFKDKFSWGEITIGLNIFNGKINNVKVFTDSLNTKIAPSLETALKNQTFTPTALNSALKNIPQNTLPQDILKDIEKLVLFS